VRPAWLTERESPPVQVPVTETPPTVEERTAARWYALRGILGRSPEDTQPDRVERPGSGAGDLLAGGRSGEDEPGGAVGRGLAARGERVLLTDTSSFGVLPFYFGAREVKPGVVRTFSGGTSDPPIRVLTLKRSDTRRIPICCGGK